MKMTIMLILSVLSGLAGKTAFTQTFTNPEQARTYFYKLDDAFNRSMVNKDSIFFQNHFSDAFINCTPYGDMHNKKQEIEGLLALPLLNVTRTGARFDVFTYSDEVATLSIIKKLIRKDSSVQYVRRTIVHKLANGKWQIVSGQGTILPKFVE